MNQVDITFVIKGDPVGKGRPRVSCRNGRPSVYTPAKTRYYEQRVHRAGQRAELQTIEGPLRVDIIAISKRPKRLKRKKDPEGIIYRPSKPDGDNVRKAILDGLSAFFDDKQVVCGDTLSLYGNKEDEEGRVVVRVNTNVGDPAHLLAKLDLDCLISQKALQIECDSQ